MSRSTRANPAPAAPTKRAAAAAAVEEDAPVTTRQLSSTSRATQEANRAKENIFLFVPNLIGESRGRGGALDACAVWMEGRRSQHGRQES